MGGLQSGLLAQFPLGPHQGVLLRPVVQLARRQLQQQLSEGIAELAHQRHVVLFIQGQNGHPAGMIDHLPGGDAPVGQPGLVHIQTDDLAVEDRLAGDFMFCKVHVEVLLILQIIYHVTVYHKEHVG